jgi:hypothetical protein
MAEVAYSTSVPPFILVRPHLMALLSGAKVSTYGTLL